MKILWFTWKDCRHPLAGGAEIVNEELAKRFVADGHEVIFLVSNFPGVAPEETINGYKVVRLGGKLTVYWRAYRYYKKFLRGWADLVIDEVNTIPFFCKFYVKEKNIILNYQLCREIWFYQMPPPFNLIGYLLEPIYLWLLHDKTVLTESESAKKDLQNYGFRSDNIFVFPVGLEVAPISETEFMAQEKQANPTLLYLGSIRKMKQPDKILKAFEIAKEKMPALKLFVVGSGQSPYAVNFFRDVEGSRFKDDITCFGRVDNEKKLEIIKKSHLIGVASIKEGWGLVVTEANSCGTPAVVYDSDGLRDSCHNNVTGIVCAKNPASLADGIVKILSDQTEYNKYRRRAWEDSFNYNYGRSYDIFLKLIRNIF